MERCLNCMKEIQGEFDICPHCGYVKGTPSKDIYCLYPGTILCKRYVIGTVVGKGGFGIVYRAWDCTLEKMVAIKEYYPAALVSRVPGEKNVYIYAKTKEKEYRNQKERFLEEARHMAKFSAHPHIVNTYNYFEENNTAYLVMEFMHGISFNAFIKQQGGIVKEETAVSITLSVLDALKVIHKAGIIHRDVAPDNVMMICGNEENTYNNVKLMDFGAARFSKGDSEEKLTRILKPGYAPREQYEIRSKQGPFTDLYAVGAMLYRAVTGVKPEESTNRVQEECLIEPKKLNPQISDKLNNIIIRAMAMQPELRFQNTEEFRLALLEKKNVNNVEEELKRRKKKRGISFGVATIALLIGIVLGVFFYQGKRAETILKPAELTLWVQAKSGEEVAVEETFQVLVDEFCDTHPQIKMNVKAVSEDTYVLELEKAVANGTMPDVFESSLLNKQQLDNVRKLDKILADIEVDEYYGLETLQDEILQLPISFARPVLYVNTTMENGNYTVEKLKMEMSDQEQMEKLFVREDTDHLIADTSNYFIIQEALPARYEMQQVPDGINENCEFVTLFSVSDMTSTAEKNAAYQFLKYLLSDNAQYSLTIKGHNGNSIGYGLPVSKEQYNVFTEINSEFEVFDNEVPKF